MAPVVSEFSDDQLIQETLSGKSEAFGELVRRNQETLFNLALRMLSSREEAEDVVQQVFVEAFRHLAGFRHGSQFSTWLYSITLNRARNHLRARKNRRWVPIDGSSNEEDGATPLHLPDKSPLPEEKIEKKFNLEWIREEVKKLPEDYQTIFTLHYFQNLSLQEIAKRLSRPLGTVKVYLHRARKELCQRSEAVHGPPLS